VTNASIKLRISRFGAVAVLMLALCFLRAGIAGHIRSGTEIIPPNNYFIAFGILFSGMGVVMAIIAIKTAIGERRIIAIY
jgi:hypothetical protein